MPEPLALSCILENNGQPWVGQNGLAHRLKSSVHRQRLQDKKPPLERMPQGQARVGARVNSETKAHALDFPEVSTKPAPLGAF